MVVGRVVGQVAQEPTLEARGHQPTRHGRAIRAAAEQRHHVHAASLEHHALVTLVPTRSHPKPLVHVALEQHHFDAEFDLLQQIKKKKKKG
jgi:hypothetical protein